MKKIIREISNIIDVVICKGDKEEVSAVLDEMKVDNLVDEFISKTDCKITMKDNSELLVNKICRVIKKTHFRKNLQIIVNRDIITLYQN